MERGRGRGRLNGCWWNIHLQDQLRRNKVVYQFACLRIRFLQSGSTGSSLASIFDGETSVIAFECGLICLYHLMALVAAAERCHSQGSLLFGMSEQAHANSKFRKIRCVVVRARMVAEGRFIRRISCMGIMLSAS
jgi:hypothetical protein